MVQGGCAVLPSMKCIKSVKFILTRPTQIHVHASKVHEISMNFTHSARLTDDGHSHRQMK